MLHFSEIIFISPGPPCFYVYVCIYTCDHFVFDRSFAFSLRF